jgi:hypothetical protein
VPEARLDDAGSGLSPATDGWFVVNVRDAQWWTSENGEKRPLRQWDFFHSPPGTEHIFVGAGDGACVILMAGARSSVDIRYPVSELAARHGASAEEETSDPDQAYVGFEPSRRARPSSWDRLPWAE